MDPVTTDSVCIYLHSDLSCGTTTRPTFSSITPINPIEYHHTIINSHVGHSWNNRCLNVKTEINSPAKYSAYLYTPHVMYIISDIIHSTLPLCSTNSIIDSMFLYIGPEMSHTQLLFEPKKVIPIQQPDQNWLGFPQATHELLTTYYFSLYFCIFLCLI